MGTHSLRFPTEPPLLWGSRRRLLLFALLPSNRSEPCFTRKGETI